MSIVESLDGILLMQLHRCVPYKGEISIFNDVGHLVIDCHVPYRFKTFFFGGHIHISYFGAAGIPVLDFWLNFLWVSNPEWVLLHSHWQGECNARSLRSPPSSTK